MYKLLFAALLICLLPAAAGAQQVFPCASAMPFSFVNGTTADANQVNTNFSTLLGCANNNGRIPIAVNLTLYVASSGSDTNNPCTNSTAPCGTVQRAVNVLQQYYQYVSCTPVVTISMAAGSYTQSTLIAGSIPGQCSAFQLVISGNTGSPDTVAVTGTASYTFAVISGAEATIQGIECFGPQGDCFRAYQGGVILHLQNDFNTAIAAQIHVDRYGVVQSIGNYSISGGAANHIWTDGQATYRWFASETLNPCCSPNGIGVTIVGTPAFSNAFVRAVAGLVDARAIVFANASGATGPQCIISDNGVVRTTTSGTLVFPGTASTCGTSHGGVFD